MKGAGRTCDPLLSHHETRSYIVFFAFEPLLYA